MLHIWRNPFLAKPLLRNRTNIGMVRVYQVWLYLNGGDSDVEGLACLDVQVASGMS